MISGRSYLILIWRFRDMRGVLRVFVGLGCLAFLRGRGRGCSIRCSTSTHGIGLFSISQSPDDGIIGDLLTVMLQVRRYTLLDLVDLPLQSSKVKRCRNRRRRNSDMLRLSCNTVQSDLMSEYFVKRRFTFPGQSFETFFHV